MRETATSSRRRRYIFAYSHNQPIRNGENKRATIAMRNWNILSAQFDSMRFIRFTMCTATKDCLRHSMTDDLLECFGDHRLLRFIYYIYGFTFVRRWSMSTFMHRMISVINDLCIDFDGFEAIACIRSQWPFHLNSMPLSIQIMSINSLFCVNFD